MPKIKVGIIGCGAIGSEIARYIDIRIPNMELVAISDIQAQRSKELADGLVKRPSILEIPKLFEIADLVIEAVSKDVAKETVKIGCAKQKDVMIMSTGGILEDLSLLDLVRKKGIRLYLPSGAIAGIDGLKAASIGVINSVTITTRKPPLGFKGAPFVVKNNINLEGIKEDTLLFEGTALEAVGAFPANINVAATLSLAGVGAKRTKVRIFACPGISSNTHEIEVIGEFGKLMTRTENLPSPKNPRTSYLAILSALATLKQIADNVKIGT